MKYILKYFYFKGTAVKLSPDERRVRLYLLNQFAYTLLETKFLCSRRDQAAKLSISVIETLLALGRVCWIVDSLFTDWI
jgi:hypothetical protein